MPAAAQVLEQVAELNKARREHPVRPVVVFTQVPAHGRVAAHMIEEARRLKLPLAPHVGMALDKAGYPVPKDELRDRRRPD